jgi:hypothetical protein
MKDVVMLTMFDQGMKIYAISTNLPLNEENQLDLDGHRKYYDKYFKRVKHIFQRTHMKKVPVKVRHLMFKTEKPTYNILKNLHRHSGPRTKSPRASLFVIS